MLRDGSLVGRREIRFRPECSKVAEQLFGVKVAEDLRGREIRKLSGSLRGFNNPNYSRGKSAKFLADGAVFHQQVRKRIKGRHSETLLLATYSLRQPKCVWIGKFPQKVASKPKRFKC